MYSPIRLVPIYYIFVYDIYIYNCLIRFKFIFFVPMHETIKGTLLITLLFIRKKLINNIMKLCSLLFFRIYCFYVSAIGIIW